MTFIKNHFTSGSKSVNFRNAQAKSCAEPENSFNLQGEQHANRAFFVRSFFTPKERLERLSMVVRDGKGSPFAVILVGRFLSLLRTTAKTLRSLAVVPEIFIQGLSAMIYLFQCVRRTEADYRYHKIYIQADSEQNARFQLHADYRPMPERPIARFQHFPTACLQATEVVYAC